MEVSKQSDSGSKRYSENGFNSFYRFSKIIAQTPRFSDYDVAVKNSDLQKMNSLYQPHGVHDYHVVMNLCIEHGNLEFFKMFFSLKREYISFIYSCIDYQRFDFVDFLRPIVDVKIHIFRNGVSIKKK